MNSLKSEFSGLAVVAGHKVLTYAMDFLAWLHTAGKDAEVLGLRLAAVASAGLGPAAGLVGSYFLARKATKLGTEAIQEQTDWLVKLQSQMHGAEEAAESLGAGAGSAGTSTTEKKTVTTKAHADATKQLEIVLPPVVQAMVQIEKSQAHGAIRAQALAILDFGENLQAPALQLPKYAESMGALATLSQQLPTYVEPAIIPPEACHALRSVLLWFPQS